MKLLSTTTAFLALLAPLSVSARAFSFDSQSPLDIESDDFKVNGTNLLVYCSNPANDILSIHSVKLSPDPPKAGQPLKIRASGNVKETIQQGSKIDIVVKFGTYIKLIDVQMDLCDQVKNVDLNCPIQKGELTLEKTVDLPAVIPNGNYDVHADARNKNEKRITCLNGNVQF